MEIEPIKLLQQTHLIRVNPEHVAASQAQQMSPAKEKANVQNTKKSESTKDSKKVYFGVKNVDSLEKENYYPTLCVSKAEYETIVNQRPLIKFRPLVNTFIKSSDKALLAESLNVEKKDVNKMIHETIQYLTYKNPSSIYYDKYKVLNNILMEEIFKNIQFERNITDIEEAKKQKLLFYQEYGSVMEPYIYRHGSKQDFLDYLKLKLSDAESALKQLYNILDTECGSLYAYFERPIHILDNRTVLKMEHIITDGLTAAKEKGYISEISYNENVEWALQRIYDIQSDTSLKEALRILREHS